MPERNFSAVWSFAHPNERGVTLQLEIADSRHGDVVRLRQISLGGVLRRTAAAIQIEVYADGARRLERATLSTARAVLEHLSLLGWEFKGFELSENASVDVASEDLQKAPLVPADFAYVGEVLPWEYRAARARVA